MSINEKENQLFKEWRSFLQVSEDEFVADGLLFHDGLHWDGYSYVRTDSGNNTENWLNAKRRLLIVTRDQPAEEGDIWDVRGDYPLTKNGEFKRNDMYKCLIQWGYAAINFDKGDEICLDDESKIEFWRDAPIARMNCGKVAGATVKNGGCSPKKLQEYLIKGKDFILKQISLYNANIIMCCSGSDSEKEEDLNPIVVFLRSYHLKDLKKLNNYVWASQKHKIIVIDCYHFANWELHSDASKLAEANRIRLAMIDACQKGYSLE